MAVRRIAAAQCSARAGPSNVASSPSPVVVTSRPPNRSSSARAASKCSREELAPARVAELRRRRRRVDEVREEQRGENSAVDPGRKAGPGADARPLDLDARLVPDVYPSWPGGMSKTSSGPNSSVVPSRELDPEPPERTNPDVPSLAPLAPDVRPDMCVDQRQPGSETSWPTVRSPSSTMSRRDPRELDDVVRRSRLFARASAMLWRLASADRVAHVRDRAQRLRERDGNVAMKIATGSPMSSTPIVCQKPSTSNAHTIAPIRGEDHPEHADERRDERPCTKRPVLRHVSNLPTRT